MFSKRRRLQLVILIALIAVCGEAGVRASTDCEKWVASYKDQLAHAKAVRRMQAANARMKRLAQRKMATYVKKPKPPAPKTLPANYVKPKPHYTKEQMLARFTLLCGDLPVENPNITKLIDGKETPEEFISQEAPWTPVEFVSMDGGELIPAGDVPPYTPPWGSGDGPGGGGGGGGLPGPPVFFGGGGAPGGPGGEVTPTGGGSSPPPATSPVPEPSSVVLLLTGVAGAAELVRRRRRA